MGMISDHFITDANTIKRKRKKDSEFSSFFALKLWQNSVGLSYPLAGDVMPDVLKSGDNFFHLSFKYAGL